MEIIFVKDREIHIMQDAYIVDFGEIIHSTIHIHDNCLVNYTFIPKNDSEISRHFLLEKWVEFLWKSVIVQNGNNEIIIEAKNDKVHAHLDLLAIATTDAHISIEGVAKVDNPYQNLSMRVDQTNILIGETAKIRGVPRLEIATNDIEWGHSCKIHRLWGDALFYLESHGLSEQNAEIFLLNSEIISHLQTLPEDIRESVCQDIHKNLYQKK